MINRKKIIRLTAGEELIVINSKNSAYNISDNGFVKINDKDLNKIKANMEITNINLDELKRFILYDVYYQHIMALDVADDIKAQVNTFMDYHLAIIHGRLYNEPDMEIKNSEFQCITYY